MISLLDDRIGAAATVCVHWSRRHARLVLWLNLAGSLLLGLYAATNLGINADNKRLLDPDLPFQRHAAAFQRHFPSMDDAILIVVDGPSPEAARGAARDLAERLRAEGEVFEDVYVPAADPFFENNGLLYRTPEELDDFADHLARLQPVIAGLERQPTIASLSNLVGQGLEQQRAAGTDAAQWSAVLDRVGQATVQVYRDYPVAISWEEMMLAGSALDPGTRQILIVDAVLEFGKPFAAALALERIRAAAGELGLVPERGFRVRVTGNPVLSYEEVTNFAWDIGGSGVVSFGLVTLLLYFALRSLRLVSAAALTLLSGIVLTAAFATVAVGQLNLVSMSFAVLFIGLGVDFAIHLGMQYADAVRSGTALDEAMEWAAGRIGQPLALCALTTSLGFFAFVPTEYRGVAELGLIAGGGMFVILLQTLTLFPALVEVLMTPDAARRLRAAPALHLAPPAAVVRHAGAIVAVAAVLGVAGASQLRNTRFDCNVVSMRDPRTESVQAFNDLLASSATSPWSVDALAPDLAAADALAGQMRALPEVESAITIEDYVPAGQEEKIEVLRDAAYLLEVPPSAPGGEPPAPAEQIRALRELRDLLGAEWLARSDAVLARAARQLRDQLSAFLARVESGGDPKEALAQLEAVLLGGLPAQIDRLRRALEAGPVTLADLPADLRRRMVAPGGVARVQIFPRDDLSDTAALERFVDAVHRIDPEATGVAVNILAFGRATAHSLRSALLLAFVAISLVLALLWRRLGDTLLVLAPLALGALLTGGAMAWLDIPFNFANVIVLPLLLGIGVDSGIHIVQVSRGGTAGEVPVDATTTRAVFFSAATTIASFGSLAFSHHRGIASMGTLLVMGMLIVLVCNLIVLPALLGLRARVVDVRARRAREAAR